MSIINLEIDDSLKARLNLLLNEFESYRIGNMNLSQVVPELLEDEKKEIEEKKISFFKKFFFSDFQFDRYLILLRVLQKISKAIDIIEFDTCNKLRRKDI